MNYFFNKGEKNDVNILIDLYDYFYSSDAHFYLFICTLLFYLLLFSVTLLTWTHYPDYIIKQQVLAPTPLCCLFSGEATNTNFIVNEQR
jgi:hypothetical protein